MSVVAIGPGLSLWAPPPLRGGAALASLYSLRAAARCVQPETRIQRCGLDVILPRSEPLAAVEVREARDGSRAAWWRGVARCHRIACPVCAAQRARSRARRVWSAVQADVRSSPDQRWQMITLTVPHSRADALADTLGGLVTAWREVRRTRKVRDIFDREVTATIRAIEVTWSSANGWHPHVHLLVRGALDAAAVEVLRDEWCRRTGAERAIGVHASTARKASEVDGRYISKLSAEVGGEGKCSADRTHWRILRRAAETAGTREGGTWRARWAEYASATKGRRMFEADERAVRLAQSCPPPEDDVLRSWTIGVWREELRLLGRLELRDREAYTYLVLRATTRGDPAVEVQREVDAILAGDDDDGTALPRAG